MLNKVLPAYLLDREATVAASRMCDEPERVAEALPDSLGDRKAVERVLHEVGASFLNFQVVAKRESEQKAQLGSTADVVAEVPYFDTDIYDISGLYRLGESIWR